MKIKFYTTSSGIGKTTLNEFCNDNEVESGYREEIERDLNASGKHFMSIGQGYCIIERNEEVLPIQPLHQFKISVASELAEFWGEKNSHTLVSQNSIAEECWKHGQNPKEAALAIDRVKLGRPQRVEYVSPMRLALNYDKKTGKLK